MSVAVTVRLYAAAAEAVGAQERAVTAGTVAEVRETLGAGGAAPVLDQCAVLRGGVRLDDSVVLGAGDVLDVLPPFAGG